MKLVKIIIGIIVVFFLLVWAINSYLDVDDLRGCGTTPSTKKGCEPADAVVAVSGGDTSARASEAIKLYQNGWGQMLIFSGAAADKSGPSNARVMEEQAITAGVDPNVIILDETSETTAQNASETSNIFKQHGIKSAILVTSAYHERRAILEFNKRATGVEIRGHPVAHDDQWGPWWWTTPIGWSLAISETVHSLILSTGGVDQR